VCQSSDFSLEALSAMFDRIRAARVPASSDTRHS
jgi:hypothetical protein